MFLLYKDTELDESHYAPPTTMISNKQEADNDRERCNQTGTTQQGKQKGKRSSQPPLALAQQTV